jgi:hypothetical protein
MKTEVKQASLEEAMAFFGQHMTYYQAQVDGAVVAMGTLTRVHGRLWGFLDLRDGLTALQALVVVRAIVRAMAAIDEPVYVAALDGIFPKAEKLIRACRFQPTTEVVHGKRIWRCN